MAAPGLIAMLPAVLLVSAAVLGEDRAKKPPAFPLSLFATAKADDYVDDQVCAGCHPDYSNGFDRSPHALFSKNPDPHVPIDKRGCQGCHGPGAKHVEVVGEGGKAGQTVIRYGKIKPAEESAACLRCHGDTMHAAQWKRSGHARADVSCVACHSIHNSAKIEVGSLRTRDPGSIRSPLNVASTVRPALLKAPEAELCAKCHAREVGQFRLSSHHPVPEGRLLCSDCHDVHPNRLANKRQPLTRDGCVSCHPDIAGPFVYEHDPVAGWTGDGCLECHKPHGSANPRMLSVFSRSLCTQCHTDKGSNHNPGMSCWSGACHVALHGSNHDRTLRQR
jgi:predicted CXXCH cytochrome family protein